LLDLSTRLSAEQRRLLRLFGALGREDKASLTAFAEFLANRSRREPPATEPVRPRDIRRPSRESVVAAIKRLSQTYFMLDRSAMLDQTSALMTAHVIQGRPAEQVIDDLEGLFSEHYRKLMTDQTE